MVRTKVFVGNLSFKTREPGLVSAFEVAGKVVGAQIVTRGNGRSLGYGFVEFESEEGANKAIKDLNKLSLDEREVNVELAKPRQEGQPAAPRRNNFQQQGGYGRRPYGGQQGGQQGGGGYGRPYGGQQGGRGGRGGYSRRPYGGQQGGGYNQGGYRRGNFNRRPPRAPKKPIEERGLQPSSTSLFVTNLPFKYTDEDFSKIFVEAGVKPKSAKVAVRFNGRSRGYGFVDFENNGEQQKAQSAVDKKTVDGRELVVKVAMYDPNAPQQQQGGQPKPAQGAPAQGAPAQGAPQAVQPKPAQGAPAQGAPQTAQPVQPKPVQPAQPTPKPAEAKPAQPAPSSPKTPASPAQKPAQKPADKK